MYFAIREDNADDIAQLIEKGANPNSVVQYSHLSPLFEAINGNKSRALRVVLDSITTKEQANYPEANTGRTALSFALTEYRVS